MKFELQSMFKTLDKVVLLAFFVSFANPFLATAFCVLVFVYVLYGVEGELKILFWITLRGILSTAVAATIGSGMIKWGSLIGASLLILVSHNLDTKEWKVRRVIISLSFFCITVGVASINVSSYPVTSCFKILAFFLTFSAVIKGILVTKERYNWADFLCAVLTILMFLSLCVLPFGRFRIVNADFQGVFNHVNVMGIMCCIYLALLLRSNLWIRRKFLRDGAIIATFIMAFFSASRTGMISCIVVLVLFILFNQTSFDGKKVIYIFLCIFIISSIAFVTKGNEIDNLIKNRVHSFIWKGNVENIWESRQEIINNSIERYEEHKITGTGFMVPYIQGFKDYSLSFDLIVEPGNMYYMLLADTGIMGLLLFVLFILVVVKCGNIKNLYLLVAAMLINMGEMGFFSSNNYSILMYFLIAIYMLDSDSYKEIDYQSMGRIG